jgi:hypothetical protein
MSGAPRLRPPRAPRSSDVSKRALHGRFRRWSTLVLLLAAARGARAGELVYADGHRESAGNPKRDSKGRWMAQRDGRTTVVKPGEVAAVVDDAGKETEIIPELAATPDTPEVTAALATLHDEKGAAKGDAWLPALDVLAAHPTRSVHDALAKLAAEKSVELRGRAVAGWLALRTKESVLAGAGAFLAESDAASRRDSASRLLAVGEIFRRADHAEKLKAGLADRDATVRFIFASIAPASCQEALPILKADGLHHSDHHFREQAALELAERGDAAGESLLVSMLERNEIPGLKTDPETAKRVLTREQIDICRLFGKLRTKTGLAALKKASASPNDEVRKAAAAALDAAKDP